jgi:hypothetical protein
LPLTQAQSRTSKPSAGPPATNSFRPIRMRKSIPSSFAGLRDEDEFTVRLQRSFLQGVQPQAQKTLRICFLLATNQRTARGTRHSRRRPSHEPFLRRPVARNRLTSPSSFVQLGVCSRRSASDNGLRLRNMTAVLFDRLPQHLRITRTGNKSWCSRQRTQD